MIDASILDRISTGICIAKKDHKVIVWNLGMEKMTGVSGSEMSGQRLQDIFPSFQDKSIQLRMEMVLTSGVPIVFSALLHRALFQTPAHPEMNHFIDTTVTSLIGADGENTLLFTVRDVTELNLQIIKYREMRDKALEEVRRREEVEAQLKEVNEQLLEQASTDPLTGLLNRRSTTDNINREID
ncbi:MAG: PAS domain-containing protein, partial [Okeania sp. SIO3B3]|nr:PAS domain-containing protein [Okeania sp. SIO3B3]